MTTLLERVKLIGGNVGGETPEAPALDLTPDPGPQLEPDPEPGQQTRTKQHSRKAAASAQTAAKQTRTGGRFVSKASVQKDIADELNSYAKMLALTWSMSDEHCAGVLNETSKAICDDLAALASRSEWVMEKFQTTSILGDCMKLLHHAWPLLRAVYVHHIAGRGDQPEEEDTGYVVPVVDPTTYGPWRPQQYAS